MDGPNDWSPANGFTLSFPSSCCMDMQVICQIGSTSVYQEGCFNKLEMRVHKGATVLIGVGIGIAFVEASKFLVLFILQDILIKYVKPISCRNSLHSY